MKGIIFNLLEEFITENLGEEGYENILMQCDLLTKEPFVGPGSYPDEDLISIASKAIDIMNISMSDALRSFGQFCMPKLAQKFPDFVECHDHPKQFLLTVNEIHYVEVIKLYEDATPPHFEYEDPDENHLIIRYSSKRKLCHFVEGLIDGVAKIYGMPIQYKQTQCMHNGDDYCEFYLSFNQ